VVAFETVLLRDKLRARLNETHGAPDYQRLAAEVLGIRNASPDLARRLVAQALVVEDRRDAWLRAGERICAGAPVTPGVYVLRNADGRALYVGKAVNLRRRLRAHFAARRWRVIKPELSQIADAEWTLVGSELEALLREASLIAQLQPQVNIHVGAPQIDTREIPRALRRDVIVLVPSIDADSVEIVAALAAGPTMIQRTPRSGVDLPVHAQRVLRFFRSVLPRTHSDDPPFRLGAGLGPPRSVLALAPIVFSWLAHRGSSATRLDPHDVRDARELRRRLAPLLRDERLFHERLSVCDGR
jgi:predicted GIY-YIG superfamily endonuclease